MMPLIGFLPATAPWMRGTVEAVEQRLVRDGFGDHYPTLPEVDGLPPGGGIIQLRPRQRRAGRDCMPR